MKSKLFIFKQQVKYSHETSIKQHVHRNRWIMHLCLQFMCVLMHYDGKTLTFDLHGLAEGPC